MTNWKEMYELEKKEHEDDVADLHMIMRIASEVYMEITGGKISKPNTAAFHIIQEADDYYRSIYLYPVKEDLMALIDGGGLADGNGLIEDIKEYLSSLNVDR